MFQRVMLGDFLEPLHPSLRSRLLERANMSTRGAAQPGAGEELFWLAWPIIKREPIPYGKADARDEKKCAAYANGQDSMTPIAEKPEVGELADGVDSG